MLICRRAVRVAFIDIGRLVGYEILGRTWTNAVGCMKGDLAVADRHVLRELESHGFRRGEGLRLA